MPEARQAVLHAWSSTETFPRRTRRWASSCPSTDWNWDGAGEQLRRAIDLNPSFSDAHERYSGTCSYIGHFDASITEARLARQLDPLSVVNNALVGLVLYRARRYDEALMELTQAIEMDPAHPTPYLPVRTRVFNEESAPRGGRGAREERRSGAGKFGTGGAACADPLHEPDRLTQHDRGSPSSRSDHGASMSLRFRSRWFIPAWASHRPRSIGWRKRTKNTTGTSASSRPSRSSTHCAAIPAFKICCAA